MSIKVFSIFLDYVFINIYRVYTLYFEMFLKITKKERNGFVIGVVCRGQKKKFFFSFFHAEIGKKKKHFKYIEGPKTHILRLA